MKKIIKISLLLLIAGSIDINAAHEVFEPVKTTEPGHEGTKSGASAKTPPKDILAVKASKNLLDTSSQAANSETGSDANSNEDNSSAYVSLDSAGRSGDASEAKTSFSFTDFFNRIIQHFNRLFSSNKTSSTKQTRPEVQNAANKKIEDLIKEAVDSIKKTPEMTKEEQASKIKNLQVKIKEIADKGGIPMENLPQIIRDDSQAAEQAVEQEEEGSTQASEKTPLTVGSGDFESPQEGKEEETPESDNGGFVDSGQLPVDDQQTTTPSVAEPFDDAPTANEVQQATRVSTIQNPLFDKATSAEPLTEKEMNQWKGTVTEATVTSYANQEASKTAEQATAISIDSLNEEGDSQNKMQSTDDAVSMETIVNDYLAQFFDRTESLDEDNHYHNELLSHIDAIAEKIAADNTSLNKEDVNEELTRQLAEIKEQIEKQEKEQSKILLSNSNKSIDEIAQDFVQIGIDLSPLDRTNFVSQQLTDKLANFKQFDQYQQEKIIGLINRLIDHFVSTTGQSTTKKNSIQNDVVQYLRDQGFQVKQTVYSKNQESGKVTGGLITIGYPS